MKFATRATAAKKATRKSRAKKRTPPALERARGALESLGAREAATIDARLVVMLALADISTLVTVTENNGAINVTPPNLLNLTFNDPQVGLDDAQMGLFYGRVTTAINDARVDALIQKHLASNPSAAVVIINVADLIQLWINNPDMQA